MWRCENSTIYIYLYNVDIGYVIIQDVGICGWFYLIYLFTYLF